jgi:hypothetical protein
VKEIEEGLKRSQKRDEFQLEQQWAVTARDVQRSMLDFKPNIVHFSGHGVGQGGLALEDANKQVKLVSGESLAKLFKLFADRGVECVLLNACYSEVQAVAIAEHIPYVIGMSQAVGDAAAREFAVGFYDALGAGESIEFAFENGCISISLAGIPEDLTPVLRRKLDSGALIQPLMSVAPPIPVNDPRSLVVVEEAAPLPPAQASLQLDVPEGMVSLDSQLYVERPPIEENCFETILKPGALIRVKAPRQMGKSSLMQRILQHANQKGHRTAHINFQSVDADFLTSLDQFLQWFCATVADALGLEDRLATQWKGILGSKNKCSNYFQRYLLQEIPGSLTLALDEVDQVFQHLEIADGFFSLLRVWHENGKNDDIWKKFHLVIAHSKEVYIPLNINQSPFNVGLPIELPELNAAQISELVHRHQLNWGDREIQQLKNVVDGHPYLLRRALYEIASDNITLPRFLEIAATDAGPFYDHLRRHLLNLQNDPKLEAAMKTVIASDQPVRIDQTQSFKLRSMGLVELRGSDVMPLCNLYRDYFRDQLGVKV